MKKSFQSWFTVFILAGMVMSCDLTQPQTSQPTAVAQPAQPATAAPTLFFATTAPTPLPATAIPTKPAATPTITPFVVDLSGARLKISDFPAGFQELDAQAQAQIGLSQETFANSFKSTFSQAKVAAMSAYLNPSAAQFEIVLTLVFHPLTQVEQAAFDQEVADPVKAAATFGQGFGSKADPIKGVDTFGNASTGMTFTSASGALTLRSDFFMVRRESAAFLVLVMYKDGLKPVVTAASLCPILDTRVKAGLGK